MAKVTRNFTLQSTPWENAKLKCSEISTLQNREIKMQLKYSVLQYWCVGLEMESAISALNGRYFAGQAIVARPYYEQLHTSWAPVH